MRWTEIESVDTTGSVALLEPAERLRVHFAVAPRAWATMRRHTIASSVEEGGVLFGTVHRLSREVAIVQIECALGVQQRDASRTRFAFRRGSWSEILRARRRLAPDSAIVGWFHSHPGFGPFFSATDRATQASHFRDPCQLGVVVDPFSDTWRAYAGAESTPCRLAGFDRRGRLVLRPARHPSLGDDPGRIRRRVRRLHPDGVLELHGAGRRVLHAIEFPPRGREWRRFAPLYRKAQRLVRDWFDEQGGLPWSPRLSDLAPLAHPIDREPVAPLTLPALEMRLLREGLALPRCESRQHRRAVNVARRRRRGLWSPSLRRVRRRWLAQRSRAGR